MWWLKMAVQIVVKNVSNFWKPKEEREWGFDLGGTGGRKVFIPTEQLIEGQYLGFDGLLYPLVRPVQNISAIDKKAAVFGVSPDLSKYEYISTNEAGEKFYRAKEYVKPMYLADQKRIDDANVAPPIVPNKPKVTTVTAKSILLGETVVPNLMAVEKTTPIVAPKTGFPYAVAGVVIGSIVLVSMLSAAGPGSATTTVGRS